MKRDGLLGSKFRVSIQMQRSTEVQRTGVSGFFPEFFACSGGNFQSAVQERRITKTGLIFFKELPDAFFRKRDAANVINFNIEQPLDVVDALIASIRNDNRVLKVVAVVMQIHHQMRVNGFIRNTAFAFVGVTDIAVQIVNA